MNIIEQAEAVIEQAQIQRSHLKEHMAQFIVAFDNDDIDEMKRLFALADSNSVLDQAIQDYTDEMLGSPPTAQEMAEAEQVVNRIKETVWRKIDGIPLARCPYCGSHHVASTIEECPLKPGQG